MFLKDWIHEKTKGKIHVYYKIPKGAQTCSLKFEAELDVPIKNLASIVYETDLFNLWLPFCKASTTVFLINIILKSLLIIKNRSKRFIKPANHFII